MKHSGIVTGVEGRRLRVRGWTDGSQAACSGCKLAAACGSKDGHGAVQLKAMAAPGYVPRVGDHVVLTQRRRWWVTALRWAVAPGLVALLSFVYPKVMVLPLLLYLIPERQYLAEPRVESHAEEAEVRREILI